jgi:hypothetical protein
MPGIWPKMPKIPGIWPKMPKSHTTHAGENDQNYQPAYGIGYLYLQSATWYTVSVLISVQY